MEKNKALEIENDKMKQQFSTKVKVKQEVFDENIEKTKVEYDEKLRNIDEERDYMIEELKVKDEELLKASEELKQKSAFHDRKVAQLQRNLKEKEKLLIAQFVTTYFGNLSDTWFGRNKGVLWQSS